MYFKIPGARRMIWNKSSTKDPQMLEDTVCNLVSMLTWQPEFVHPWSWLITAVAQQGIPVLIPIVSDSSIIICGYITSVSLRPAPRIKTLRALLTAPVARLPPASLSDCTVARQRLQPTAPLQLPSHVPWNTECPSHSLPNPTFL